MTPQLTKEGKPYGPEKFQQLMREEYLISKETHNSIREIDQLTPREREIMLNLILKEKEVMKKQIDEMHSRGNKR